MSRTVKIADKEAFIKKYPKLTKEIPAREASIEPDTRRILSFISMGGVLDGVTVVTDGSADPMDDEQRAIQESIAPGSSFAKPDLTAGVSRLEGEDTRSFFERCRRLKAEQEAAAKKLETA